MAWRDAALLKLARVGVDGSVWAFVDDLISHRVCRARVNGQLSCCWADATGVGQGAVLSPLLFNLVINGLAAAVRRVHGGVAVGLGADAPRVSTLLYADDLVILADTPEQLQRALDAAYQWARQWRFTFGVRPTKSAVLCVHPPRRMPPPLRLGDDVIPYVTEYKYLGVRVHARLSWRRHAELCVAAGERRMASAVTWASREHLPVTFTSSLVNSFVLGAASYGCEFLADAGSLRLLQTRWLRWGRRILGWPAGAPGAAVLGELGWLDFGDIALLRRARLFARLSSVCSSSSRRQVSSALFEYALSQPRSWAATSAALLSESGAPAAELWGIGPGAPHALQGLWITSAVEPAARHTTLVRFHSACAGMESLHDYVQRQPVPALDGRVYGAHVPADAARLWGLARCGHHPCGDGRPARHLRLPSGSMCALCGCAPCGLEHLLFTCTGTAELRSHWFAGSSMSLSLDTLFRFDYDGRRSSARHVARCVRFVAAAIWSLLRVRNQGAPQ